MLRSPDSLPNGKADLQEKQVNATVNDAAVSVKELSPAVNGHSASQTPLPNGATVKDEALASDSSSKSPATGAQPSLGEVSSAQPVSRTTDATSETPAVSVDPGVNNPPTNSPDSKSAEPSNNLAASDDAMTENGPALQAAPSAESTSADVIMQDSEQNPQQDASTTLPHHPSSTTKPDSSSETLTSKEATESVSRPADQAMTDAPPSPVKVQRERDVDPGEEPAAKRTKTNGDAPEASTFKVPDAPTTTNPPAEPSAEGSSITKVQHKFLTKCITSLKRMHDARFFREPVDPVKMNIPTYPSIITRPMDLSTIEKKLKGGQYETVDALVDDFNLMVQNAVTFNGPEHLVSQEGLRLKATFEKQMANLPKPDEVEEKKPKKGAAAKAPAARRESRSTGGQTAQRQNATSPQSTTFALGPEGLPLIRRDSTNADGRPKRSIHPPKRDLPYASKPKKKKYQWELKFCQEVLDELHKPKYYNIAAPFYYPVDPVALNIPTYHNIIKKPMDLSTVQTKLKTGQYENAKEMEVDMRQIFKNCFKFNIPGDPTYMAGKKLEEVFEAKWAQKARWLEMHDPNAGHHSASSDEESEDEAEDSDDDADQEKLQMLQRQIAEMSKQVEAITAKKKKTPPASKKSGKSKTGKKDSKKGLSKKDKKVSKSGKPEKQHWVTYQEKQIISNGISSLPDKKMQEALKIIQNNVPSLKVCFVSMLFLLAVADADRYLGYPRDRD